ncbi:M23 family metallopeptidase [Trichlorobacter ammonificans]|uniref:Zinc metalloendopeptidase M23 domain protein n=1 Tax=Trichlorobacter ammonificans TaxID=2916410 RepID=A0ABN8HN58_9BACT|nr:M23 family metallopeptidase [Trichlorobacter ammonificans]CAH2031459.1 Zinc metalloendopeptidase M23 domain protein [Trichlorobacter ammonificans]
MRNRLYPWLKKLSTPVTIMLVPHTRSGAINLKLPLAVLGLLGLFVVVGIVYTFSLTVHAVDYLVMKHKYEAMNGQFQALQGTMQSLRQADSELRRLLSGGSRSKILDEVRPQKNDGSVDLEELKRQVEESMQSVAGIRQYLAQQRDLHRATPQGWPVDGTFTSGFGMREHPLQGSQRFHSGVDLSTQRGTPVMATADGIVSVSGYGKGNGNVVVIEHGHGFSTVYAHNDRNAVRVGQTVRRGEVIAYAGATGATTGVHVHYEVWRNGRPINPSDTVARAR